LDTSFTTTRTQSTVLDVNKLPVSPVVWHADAPRIITRSMGRGIVRNDVSSPPGRTYPCIQSSGVYRDAILLLDMALRSQAKFIAEGPRGYTILAPARSVREGTRGNIPGPYAYCQSQRFWWDGGSSRTTLAELISFSSALYWIAVLQSK
jgi:hypothetical protein